MLIASDGQIKNQTNHIIWQCTVTIFSSFNDTM